MPWSIIDFNQELKKAAQGKKTKMGVGWTLLEAMDNCPEIRACKVYPEIRACIWQTFGLEEWDSGGHRIDAYGKRIKPAHRRKAA